MTSDSIVGVAYQMCAHVMLQMLSTNILTDREYEHIMDKLNTWKRKEGESDEETNKNNSLVGNRNE